MNYNNGFANSDNSDRSNDYDVHDIYDNGWIDGDGVFHPHNFASDFARSCSEQLDNDEPDLLTAGEMAGKIARSVVISAVLVLFSIFFCIESSSYFCFLLGVTMILSYLCVEFRTIRKAFILLVGTFVICFSCVICMKTMGKSDGPAAEQAAKLNAMQAKVTSSRISPANLTRKTAIIFRTESMGGDLEDSEIPIFQSTPVYANPSDPIYARAASYIAEEQARNAVYYETKKHALQLIFWLTWSDFTIVWQIWTFWFLFLIAGTVAWIVLRAMKKKKWRDDLIKQRDYWEQRSEEYNKMAKEEWWNDRMNRKGPDQNTSDSSTSQSSSDDEPEGFFDDVTNREDLDKRYKAMAKALHPDSPTGSLRLFQKLQAEYEKKKEELG